VKDPIQAACSQLAPVVVAREQSAKVRDRHPDIRQQLLHLALLMEHFDSYLVEAAM